MLLFILGMRWLLVLLAIAVCQSTGLNIYLQATAALCAVIFVDDAASVGAGVV